jgi:hypothetical protein
MIAHNIDTHSDAMAGESKHKWLEEEENEQQFNKKLNLLWLFN